MANLWTQAPAPLPGPERSEPIVHLARSPSRWDQLRPNACDNGQLDMRHERLAFTFMLEGLARTGDWQLARALTRNLKRLKRCNPDVAKEALDQARTELAGSPDPMKYIEQNHTQPLGGYRLACPPWSLNLRYLMFHLGVRFPHESGNKAPDAQFLKVFKVGYGRAHRTGAKSVVAANRKVLSSSDIVGFTGHHYTSHLIPGWFTDINTEKGLDLRYSLDDRPEGFANVKLVFATGCSLLCSDAQQVLQALFPRAVFIGQKNTMPLTAGDRALRALRKQFAPPNRRALLLDNAEDFEFLIDRWQAAAAAALTKNVRKVGPGSVRGEAGKLLINHEPVKIEDIDVFGEDNRCQRKADDRSAYPGPTPKSS